MSDINGTPISMGKFSGLMTDFYVVCKSCGSKNIDIQAWFTYPDFDDDLSDLGRCYTEFIVDCNDCKKRELPVSETIFVKKSELGL